VKVAHLVIGGDVAGGQLVALALARASRERGDEAVILSPTPGPLLDRCAAAGIPARVVPLGGALNVRALLRLRRALREERASFVHTHGHFSVNVLGRLAGRLAGATVVSHLHIENVFRAGVAGRVQRLVDRSTARLCGRVLAVSEATARTLGYPARLVEVVPNGVDLAPAEPTSLVDGPTVLEVARLAPVKGQRELIEALAAVPGARLVLVGVDAERGGAYRAALEEVAREAGVADRVLFAGRRDDVPSLLAGADVVALPSFAEGLPLTILEAMAQARPVVATAVGGSGEAVVDGETGVLVPAGDVEALGAALRLLLGDADLRRRLGEAGRRRVQERFSTAAMTRRVLAVYDELAPTMSR
jgi:glycosyltransferase involved in cell wall biosynthesis